MQTETIHHIPYVNSNLTSFINYLEKHYIDQKIGAVISTVNPEIAFAAIRDQDYFDVLSSSNFILPDGIGVVMMSRLTNNRLQSRIAGYDVFKELLGIADKKKKRIFLYGAKKDVIKGVVSKISSEYPNIQIAGYSDGYVQDRATVAKQIAKANPDMVFVALGYPHQEKFIHNYRHLFPKAVSIGLGGSFDVFSGNVKRAPSWMIRLNLEWFYRLILNPWRWKRMLSIPKYALAVFKEEKNKKTFYPKPEKDHTKQI
ncbi:N-acetylglucosaminyldiphosphoundecaprenol N-acetyl-beta-D- mannosaminyltransferase [Bacillus inaquosorum]|uniref:N-acetylglucosaminyldiphosphoundecaprenol N-acetyl-beta-D- mannosaminyltransferase n=1 Tax=Bacillus inaquosorum TaxID=483913 RepID=UPI00227E0D94|nr:N-acetylglucosaminyldiphosphoundecaprenol N-acetyl-beta-D- mannosaminyltransferase [Bacillus inaquosorum]MCY7759450.1 N-acetylglucosaminyldiphosphoundecaprenol N-acetyl-beta-D- mannosaminyltransferase [Bacillus inaquosorum]MCY8175298.1 N-acetylglucosaminyldiphosphoundecaprenol N-acetyl-beta-D- mannosaminyltransferase [Bacillus inaquosorum]MCY8722575.1 N-acetylglucosaminyldiphosphoundecaprenol N-acetyl-beta-D- mannosaminyltransferase [Bacillus inaquosorum]MCY8732650.1 N-acetylglucosaminyldiph